MTQVHRGCPAVRTQLSNGPPPLRSHRDMRRETRRLKRAIPIDKSGQWRHLKFEFIRDSFNSRKVYPMLTSNCGDNRRLHIHHISRVAISQNTLSCRPADRRHRHHYRLPTARHESRARISIDHFTSADDVPHLQRRKRARNPRRNKHSRCVSRHHSLGCPPRGDSPNTANHNYRVLEFKVFNAASPLSLRASQQRSQLPAHRNHHSNALMVHSHAPGTTPPPAAMLHPPDRDSNPTRVRPWRW